MKNSPTAQLITFSSVDLTLIPQKPETPIVMEMLMWETWFI